MVKLFLPKNCYSGISHFMLTQDISRTGRVQKPLQLNEGISRISHPVLFLCLFNDVLESCFYYRFLKNKSSLIIHHIIFSNPIRSSVSSTPFSSSILLIRKVVVCSRSTENQKKGEKTLNFKVEFLTVCIFDFAFSFCKKVNLLM